VGRIEAFEPREEGRLRMVLTFANVPGKTSSNGDVVEVDFRAKTHNPTDRVDLLLKG
jgi:hypothetical protein